MTENGIQRERKAAPWYSEVSTDGNLFPLVAINGEMPALG